MREMLKQSWGIVIVLAVVACGSNDDSGTSDSAEGAAATGGTSAPTAGKSGTAGTTSPRAGTGATATAGTAARAGTSGSTQPPAAGKSGAAGGGAKDEDAGVEPVGGAGGQTGSAGHAAGSGGTTGAAGSAGAGKAGSGGSAGAAGGGTGAGATFTEVYALISKGCAGAACHVNTTITSGGMLSMSDKATAYKNLVGVNATQCMGEKRVVANDPAKSELVASLKHTQVGSCTRTPRMPDNMPQWNDADIAVVTSWIEAGAQDN